MFGTKNSCTNIVEADLTRDIEWTW